MMYGNRPKKKRRLQLKPLVVEGIKESSVSLPPQQLFIQEREQQEDDYHIIMKQEERIVETINETCDISLDETKNLKKSQQRSIDKQKVILLNRIENTCENTFEVIDLIEDNIVTSKEEDVICIFEENDDNIEQQNLIFPPLREPILSINTPSKKLEFDEEKKEEETENMESNEKKLLKEMKLLEMNELYRKNLLTSVTNLTKQTTLILSNELETCHKILNSSRVSQTILSRLLFLQGPWFRISTCHRYIPHRNENELQELFQLNILCKPETEEEWLSIISFMTTGEVFTLLKQFHLKAKLETKEIMCQKILEIVNNKNTLFNAPKVKIEKYIKKCVSSEGGEFVKISSIVFKLCKRAISLYHCYIDLSIDDNYIAKIDFLQDAKIRNGTRIPTYYSPGFNLVFGEEEIEKEEEELFDIPSPFISLEHLLYLEAAQEVLELIRIKLVTALDAEVKQTPSIMSCEFIDIGMESLFSKTNHLSILHHLPNDMSIFDICQFVLTTMIECKNEFDLPIHLIPHHDPMYLLCTAISESLDYFEGLKEYSQSIYLLEGLLSLSKRAAKMHRKRSYWYNRLAIDLGHENKQEQALFVCQNAINDENIHKNDAGLLSIRSKLAKSNEITTESSTTTTISFLNAPIVNISAKPFGKAGKGSGAKGKQAFIHPNDISDVTCNVEQYALNYYRENGGWRGIHTENFALREIFTIFMKNEIIGKKKEEEFKRKLIVFRNRPLDIASTSFYENRKEMIEERLEEIRKFSNEEIAREVKELYNIEKSKKRSQTRGVSCAMLQLIALCLGSNGIASVCDMFCREYKSLGYGGAPDLLMVKIPNITYLDLIFDQELSVIDSLTVSSCSGGLDDDDDNNEIDEKRCCCKFVEVKSENDRLADRQIIWMNALYSRNFDCEVLKLSRPNKKKIENEQEE